MNEARADFAAWAASYAGCDGGNLRGRIWLCGLEFGGDIAPDVLRRWISEPILTPPADYTPDRRQESLGYRYNLKAIKLFRSIKNREHEPIESFLDSERCFEQDGDYFKLNLFPIPFRNISPVRWRAQGLEQHTGLASRTEYENWCRLNRFPAIRSWVSEGRPRLVIGTGVSYVHWFRSAFSDFQAEVATLPYTVGEKHFRIEHFTANGGETLVAVIHFLNHYDACLNSDVRISATGRHLAYLLDQYGLT